MVEWKERGSYWSSVRSGREIIYTVGGGPNRKGTVEVSLRSVVRYSCIWRGGPYKGDSYS